MQGKRAMIAKDNLMKTKDEEMENLVERNKEREDRLNTLLRESESRHCEIYLFIENFLRYQSFLNESYN